MKSMNYFNKINSRFNRTFMELKLCNSTNVNATCYRFNRTFMELKYATDQDTPVRQAV